MSQDVVLVWVDSEVGWLQVAGCGAPTRLGSGSKAWAGDLPPRAPRDIGCWAGSGPALNFPRDIGCWAGFAPAQGAGISISRKEDPDGATYQISRSHLGSKL
jgi:hypothetical protein